MPIKKKTKTINDVIEEVTEEIVTNEVEFSVYDMYDKYVRTYSLEFHGKEAESLAKGFALKINGKIK